MKTADPGEDAAPFVRSAELARLAEVSPDTLRHYEKKGLLPRARRSPNGYREYPPEARARVRLVRRAIALGFSLDEVAAILAVRDRGGAPCRSVRALAQSKFETIERRLAELNSAREALRDVLVRWDALLAAAPPGARVGLLDALEGIVAPGAPSPFLPPPLRPKRRPDRVP
ncbi:MAG TPA: MerR family transcriptional regulator [Vicinamibacteria bacterium]|jgi:DNA-binding transcriptional MerR regulator